MGPIEHQGWSDPGDFFTVPAFSFSTQPDLRELFREVAQERQKITLVVGAGASLDAGLPTWSGLLENITDLIKEDRWKRTVRRDYSEPMRKAEYVIRLASEGRASTPDEIVRDALYASGSRPPFGALADAIARLTLSAPDQISIITTNFDTLIEQALTSYHEESAESYRLQKDDIKAWKREAFQTPPPVLHVHGILVPGESPRDPIVLTESTFLKHGVTVRSIIKERLAKTLVVFIGVSLSDPNLIGPLWDTRDLRKDQTLPGAAKRPVVFLVTDAGQDVSEDTGQEQLAYAVKRAEFLTTEFDVRTIFSKSYAQQTQIIADLGLACIAPDRYLEGDKATTLRYGPRFTDRLDRCYEQLNCGPDEDLPTGDCAEELSQRLHDMLYDETTGPLVPVRAFVDTVKKSSARSKKLGREAVDFLEDERFGLFLWLRARNDPGNFHRPHEVRCLGSSAYTHREPWSLDRKAAVVSFSRHAAAQAAFYGRTHMQNFDERRDWQLWRSIVAVPFTVHSDRSNNEEEESLDNLLVGVLTLNSTGFLQPDRRTSEWGFPRSALSHMTADDVRAVTDRMVACARSLFA